MGKLRVGEIRTRIKCNFTLCFELGYPNHWGNFSQFGYPYIHYQRTTLTSLEIIGSLSGVFSKPTNLVRTSYPRKKTPPLNWVPHYRRYYSPQGDVLEGGGIIISVISIYISEVKSLPLIWAPHLFFIRLFPLGRRDVERP